MEARYRMGGGSITGIDLLAEGNSFERAMDVSGILRGACGSKSGIDRFAGLSGSWVDGSDRIAGYDPGHSRSAHDGEKIKYGRESIMNSKKIVKYLAYGLAAYAAYKFAQKLLPGIQTAINNAAKAGKLNAQAAVRRVAAGQEDLNTVTVDGQVVGEK